jgi:hypothetical protein
MRRLNPLTYLSRPDKWYLGGGNRLLWAPPFPVWLDYPGFWDKAHYYNLEIDPVFTWTILDEDGEEVALRASERRWDPSKLMSRYSMNDVGSPLRTSEIGHRTSGLSFSEEQCCLPNDVLASVVTIRNASNKSRKLHLVAWTIQPTYPSQRSTWLTDIECEREKIHFTKHIQSAEKPHFQFACSLGVNRKVISYSINLSEGSAIQPHWRFTPFAEKFRNGKLPNECNLSGINDDGLLYIALHVSSDIKPKREEKVSVLFSASPSRAECTSNLSFAGRQKDIVEVSRKSWEDYFSGVPYFECSDEYITRYYWYRWYGLKLLTTNVSEKNYQHPFVSEGIGYFRAPISYSAMCHILENRWMHNPALPQGSLMTFIDGQREDGAFRGYIDPYYYRRDRLGEPFYHANWGKVLLALDAVHPDEDFLAKVYDGLVGYVRYFDSQRDPEQSNLYDIHNHYETGQEYMHRYVAVDTDADKDNWGEVFRLKGVDVTVYMYELKKALAVIAKRVGRSKEEELGWSRGAEAIKDSMLQNMWDPVEQMFFDVNPVTGQRTMVKAASCFYPYMTDMVNESHISGFKSHLFNPKEFWTNFPIPSSSVDDVYFSPEAEWKGKRMNCPWNGRVWPMTNSHIAEALGQSALRSDDDALRKKTAQFIFAFIRMMFFDGDPKRPNCFEHYSPLTGTPSEYRGVDDYQHSWVVELIMKYVVGIQANHEGAFLRPFPFTLDSIVLDTVVIAGKRMRIEKKKSVWSILIDGKKYFSGAIDKKGLKLDAFSFNP